MIVLEQPIKDRTRRLSWICIKDRRVLFVRAPGTPMFFDPGCWAVQGLGDEVILRHKMRKELTVTILEMYKDTSFRAQAYDKPEGEMIEMHLYLTHYVGSPNLTPYVEEMRWLTASGEAMELTTDAGKAILQYLALQGLIYMR